MPTAAEHRAEANVLSDMIETIRAVRSDVLSDRDDLGVTSESIRIVNWVVGAAITELEALGGIVAFIVNELHWRAALCDQYTAALQRYDEAHRRWATAVQQYRIRFDTDRPARWPGPEPVPPAAPFPWAVAG
jgi:hypothetical protein